MKTLVGVDFEGHYVPSVQLCRRLDFPKQEFVLVHAVEVLPSYAPVTGTVPHTAEAWMNALRTEGESTLTAAQDVTGGSPTVVVLRDGPAAAALMDEAELRGADMIAIGGWRKDSVSLLIFGSVARGMAVGAQQSLMITKGELPNGHRVKALLATDHSDYAQRCLKQLLKWAPRGLDVVGVATAYTKDERFENEEQRSMIERMSRDVILQIGDSSLYAQIIIEEGRPNEVIRNAMQSTGADLLIVGAQGHGFFERLLIGSVALHQIIAEPYPVMVIRVPLESD